MSFCINDDNASDLRLGFSIYLCGVMGLFLFIAHSYIDGGLLYTPLSVQ